MPRWHFREELMHRKLPPADPFPPSDRVPPPVHPLFKRADPPQGIQPDDGRRWWRR